MSRIEDEISNIYLKLEELHGSEDNRSFVEKDELEAIVNEIKLSLKSNHKLLNTRIDTIKGSIKSGKDKELESLIRHLQKSVTTCTKDLSDFKSLISTQLCELKDSQINLPLHQVEEQSEHRSRSISSFKPSSVVKDIKSVKASTIEENLTPSNHQITEVEAELKQSIEMSLSEEKIPSERSFEAAKVRREHTKSSKHTSWNTQRVDERINGHVGEDIQELKRKIDVILVEIKKIKNAVNENFQEIEYNRRKLFHFMKAEKNNLDTQERLAMSIKKGIKQANQHSNLTVNDFNKSYFSKFHSPRDISPEGSIQKNKTFFSSSATRMVVKTLMFIE
jgi:hypothetical protein